MKSLRSYLFLFVCLLSSSEALSDFKVGDLFMNLQQYNKAYVPIGVGVALYLFSLVGVNGDMKLSDAVTMLITAALVYFVPNKK